MIKRIGKLLQRIVPVILIWIVVLDLVLIGAVLVSKRELGSAMAEYGRATGNAARPTPAGFLLDGRPLEFITHKAGYAIWYAAKQCPYCQKDEEFRRLAVSLDQRGLRVLVVLPDAGDAFATDSLPANATQVAYMNPEWLRRYPLSVTPTLLLFDGGHRLVWRRYGMLRPVDTAEALRAVDLAIRGRLG